MLLNRWIFYYVNFESVNILGLWYALKLEIGELLRVRTTGNIEASSAQMVSHMCWTPNVQTVHGSNLDWNTFRKFKVTSTRWFQTFERLVFVHTVKVPHDKPFNA